MALARTLGPEGRGLLALVLLLPELVKCFALLGFEQANAVYAGLEPEGHRLVVLALGRDGLGDRWNGRSRSIYYVCYVGAPGFHGLVSRPGVAVRVPIATIPARLLHGILGSDSPGDELNLPAELDRGRDRVVSVGLILICVVGLGAGVAGVVWIDAACSWARSW